MAKKALVLSSGGLDSTTCLALAVQNYGAENVSSVSIFYGQKHDKELKAAKEVASYYGLEGHYTLDLSAIYKYSNCSLLANSTEEISHDSYAEQIARDGMVKTYVPFRNGLMLSAVASLAGSIYPDDLVSIYIGAHSDDAAGNAYADCSLEFIRAITEAINIGTYKKIKVVAPLILFTKADVVECGLKLGAPYELTWSCYEGGETPCGTCATCLDRERAFKMNKIEDPALQIDK